MTGYIRSLTDGELEKLRENVSSSLGLPFMVSAAPEERTAPVSSVTQEQIADALKNVMEVTMPEHDKMVRLQAERDIYRDLFEKERTAV